MKKFFLFWVILTASISVAIAQYAVTGRITDANGNPVANASVSEKGSSRGTVTDNNGNYKLNLRSKQNATITVSIVGFKRRK